MTPSLPLLQRLARAKLLTRGAAASIGVGERRSAAKGSGMEFADHREYQPGDDVRHLDPHIYARLGESYIRQYEIHKQLPITIVVDGSRSMDYGTPTKFEAAKTVAATLGFVGLAGGDQVQLAVWSGEKLHWSPRFHGPSRSRRLFDWIEEHRVGVGGSFGLALHQVARQVTSRGLLILAGDWWDEGLEADIRTTVAARQEIWGLHLIAPEELEPGLLGEGEVRLTDAETGSEIELSLDRATLDRYRTAFATRRERLRDMFGQSRGRYLPVVTSDNLERLVLQDWRKAGIIG